jgi:hypothetical protein
MNDETEIIAELREAFGIPKTPIDVQEVLARAGAPSGSRVRRSTKGRIRLGPNIPRARLAVAWVVLIGLLALGLAVGLKPTPSKLRVSAPTSNRTKIRAELPPSDVIMLQMFNARSGVGIGELRHRYYLVRTGDGGSTWAAEGAIPRDGTTQRLWPLQSSLLFKTYAIGYFDNGNGAPLFTDNGGRTWATVGMPGLFASDQVTMSLSGDSLWAFAQQCQNPVQPDSCHLEMLAYQFGALTPTSVLPIPIEGRADLPDVFLLDRAGPRSGIIREGQISTSILGTSDGGARWSLLSDPCGTELSPMGFAMMSATHWVLYCELDGGMNQGTVKVFTSENAGSTWILEASANESGTHEFGRVGDGIAGDLTVSGNRSILWDLGPVCCVGYSLDGGRTWKTIPIETGGDFTQIASEGSTEAWLPTDGGLYHTTNGTSWSKLP